MIRASLLLCLAVQSTVVCAQEPLRPKVNDDRLEASLFALEPLIQTPIGMTFDKAGRLIVIESHTHFRPKDWKGPEHDQIVWLKDTNGDGRADTREVILNETVMTMDIATHPDGSLYLSTRNEILRLRDNDGDGKYEQVDRKLVWLESEGKYPHNGLSGLAFDAKGGLYFGMGENLGAAYTLTGTDGIEIKDQGEGGNIWHVDANGKRLRRVATGFWNAFGVCTDPWGNVFATDNDPDSSPPCRLQHIIEGGDYGYQFRYGRSGLHPFISWNGELPGMLPMLAGTGESPCDVIFYAPPGSATFAGLSEKWHGTLLVASWVDHRVESYQLTPKDGTFQSKLSMLIEGGQDFRPVAFAVAPDGSLYVSDWVKRDYELHGRGRVWRIGAKEPAPLTTSPVKPYPADPDSELRERILTGPTPTDAEASQWLAQTKPFLLSAALWRMTREGEQLRAYVAHHLAAGQVTPALLIASRRALDYEGTEMNDLAAQLISRSLVEPDNTLSLLAMKWVSDRRLTAFRPLVEARLKDSTLNAAGYYAALTTLARLDSADATETQLVKRLKQDLSDGDLPAERRKLALEILPDRDRNVTAAEVFSIFKVATRSEKEWFVHYLGTLHDPARMQPLREIALDSSYSPAVRAAAMLHVEWKEEDTATLVALVTDEKAADALRLGAAQTLQGLPLNDTQKQVLSKIDNLQLAMPLARILGKSFAPVTRPDFGNIVVWKNYLKEVPGKPDLDNGRRVFMSPKLGGCAVCHRADGTGGIAGPNLATIGRATDETYLLESLLQPSRNVAPQFEAFMLSTADGQGRIAFRLIERGGTHTYVDIAGKQFNVKIEDIIARVPMPVSIMPEGMVNKLTDAEVRDLIVYLQGLAE